MGLAARGDDPIARNRNAPRLQPFLQLGLGVLRPARDLGRLDHLAEQAVHEVARRRQPAVEEGRADQRLERVGEDRRAQRATATRLTFAETERLGQAELKRRPVQAVLANEVGANAGQIAFVGIAETVEQQAGDDQAQDGITEELEALVVVGTMAGARCVSARSISVGSAKRWPILRCSASTLASIREIGSVRWAGRETSSSGPRT